jgi:hypothetical protein
MNTAKWIKSATRHCNYSVVVHWPMSQHCSKGWRILWFERISQVDKYEPAKLSQYSDYALGWTSEESQFDSRRRLDFCLISKAFRSVTYPGFYSVGTGGFFREAMWLGRQTDHSSSSSTKVKWNHNIHFLTCHHEVHKDKCPWTDTETVSLFSQH